jgi:PIN domain nuclease of toxin-antitoxin system
VTVLDSCAVIAALVDEPGRGAVEALLRTDHCAIPAVNLAEVHDHVVRRFAAQPGEVARAMRLLELAGLEVLPIGDEIAIGAGLLRAEHYHRTRRPISIADSIALACAMEYGQRLATSDRGLVEVARAVGVEVVALADSSGRHP